MNIFFRSLLSSSSRSLHIHYSIFISNNIEEKKNTKAEEDNQHVSLSVEEEIKMNLLIFYDKMTASSMLNNSREFEKESNESSKSS